MLQFKNLGLFTKISIIILLILLGFFSLFTFLNFRQQRAFIMGEAVEKARIVAFEAIRTREYLSSQLLEGGVELSRQRYGLVPVVASTRVGELVSRDLGYTIRQVSDRYRNANNAPDDFEVRVLELFRQRQNLQEHYDIVDMGGKKVFRYLHSFKADTSCLECHGDPGQAPDFIREMFPADTDKAYHYELGDVIGAASVSIPLDRLYRQIYANMGTDVLYSGGIFLALLIFLGALIRIAVTRPLARLGEVIREIIRTGRFDQKISRRGLDEIGLLVDSFNELNDHLREKTEHLEESEKRFRVLTETARDGIVSFLSNGQIILFNRRAEKMFGYSKREIIGVSVEKLIHEECTSLQGVGIAAYLKEEAGALVRSLHQVPGRKRDGGLFYLEVSLSVAESEGHLFYTAIVRERT